MDNKAYVTGDSVPKGGKYKILNRIDGGELDKEDTEVMLEKGQQFPHSPSTHKEVRWEKIN
ncbi:YjzC family protein [Halobacillus karajensis]|uniref:YjzC-like protein n=1 Tax=Halobacillus karajensis TaxID=195088 RepID=A0A024P9I1_9BACI|nr:YjzC family protein [Halobacillus karajensis]CDQ21328.1 hypothetical protein BN982_03695 [Halobacillus karajensis]CDQ25600.1 hypothetical protein BN983_03956 [Halobacillus karajensis]CDQ25869.1 hypothetical protein BN981_00075 [Halobacillus karajensis]